MKSLDRKCDGVRSGFAWTAKKPISTGAQDIRHGTALLSHAGTKIVTPVTDRVRLVGEHSFSLHFLDVSITIIITLMLDRLKVSQRYTSHSARFTQWAYTVYTEHTSIQGVSDVVHVMLHTYFSFSEMKSTTQNTRRQHSYSCTVHKYKPRCKHTNLVACTWIHEWCATSNKLRIITQGQIFLWRCTVNDSLKMCMETGPLQSFSDGIVTLQNLEDYFVLVIF